MKHLLLWLLLPAVAVAQRDGTAVSLSQSPTETGFQFIGIYSGTNMTYRCITRSSDQLVSITVSAASNANPVSFTATAHGLDYPSAATITPLIKITGGTGNWTAVNGVWTATITSANAFTIPVDSSALGSFTGQSLTVTTYAVPTTVARWAIQKYVYDGSSNLLWSGWSAGAPGGAGATTLIGGSPRFGYACASRTTYSYQ